jgi:hypothetical protein
MRTLDEHALWHGEHHIRLVFIPRSSSRCRRETTSGERRPLSVRSVRRCDVGVKAFVVRVVDGCRTSGKWTDERHIHADHTIDNSSAPDVVEIKRMASNCGVRDPSTRDTVHIR